MDGETILYVHHDNIGSIMAYTDEDKQIVQELIYDAWGRRRKPDTFEYYELASDYISISDRGFTGHEHIDRFDMINMNGRIYDPVVGRFLSPDPYVQAPDFTQSLNRYAYCINNPLTLTDPSGYNWIENAFATVVGIAVGIETGGLATGVYGAMIGGALGGASASMLSSVFNGANLWQTAKNTFTGAFWGAASGTMNFEIGNIGNVYSRIAAHTAAEGAMEGIRGGHVEHGLLMGFTSSAGGAMINRYATNLTYAERVAVNATLGGVVSELGGGKFASGAMTAAYSMMFNDLKHNFSDKQLKRIYDAYIKGSYDNNGNWMSPKELCKEIGGYFTEIAEYVENGCAIRLSYAMNKSGMKIPHTKGTFKGGDGNWYFIRASDMYNHLRQWHVATVYNGNNIKNGIVFERPNEKWIEQGISGHVDIVYRRFWASQYQYSNYYGGTPHDKHITDVIH